MTTVLTGGDSFTAHIMEDNVAWPNHINKAKDPWKECKVINVSEMASDNVLIARNVIKGLEKHQEDVTHVIIGWSDPNRFSLYVNQEHPLYMDIYEIMKDCSSVGIQISKKRSHEKY